MEAEGAGGSGVLSWSWKQGTRDPHRKQWHAEHHGLCSLGAKGSSCARLERFAGRCNRCSNAASQILKPIWASR